MKMNLKNMTIAAKRQLALYHLRVNPKNRNKIEGSLKRGPNDRCALGVIAEAFDIPCTRSEILAKGYDPIYYSPYEEIGNALGIGADYTKIYGWNDAGQSFTEVADHMEIAFERSWKLIEDGAAQE
jgi:hypothetical protein